ncbi:MAG: tRNA (adenosine(37)-N6)-threonylcarbamoyltransferase complex dimerization subunit type 1 TsaB [Pseudomonadota bacterium]
MLVLGLDTALQRCSVAILSDSVVVASQSVCMERGHAEHLAPMAAAVLAEAGVSVIDLDRIGVVVGPGGFTGVRVALAFARGLVIGTEIPAVPVTSLAALAANVSAPTDALIAPVIDARREQVYAGLYDDAGDVLVAPFVAAPKEALSRLLDRAGSRPVSLVGSGSSLLSPPSRWSHSGADDQIDAAVVARLAAFAPEPYEPPRPLYLRAPDAKPPKQRPMKAGSRD